MVGTTGKVRRSVEVQDTRSQDGQAIVIGTHSETVDEACVVLAELPDGRLRVLVFASDEQRDVDVDEFGLPVASVRAPSTKHPDLLEDAKPPSEEHT